MRTFSRLVPSKASWRSLRRANQKVLVGETYQAAGEHIYEAFTSQWLTYRQMEEFLETIPNLLEIRHLLRYRAAKKRFRYLNFTLKQKLKSLISLQMQALDVCSLFSKSSYQSFPMPDVHCACQVFTGCNIYSDMLPEP